MAAVSIDFLTLQSHRMDFDSVLSRIPFLTFLAEIKHGRDATVSHYCPVRYSFRCPCGARVWALLKRIEEAEAASCRTVGRGR